MLPDFTITFQPGGGGPQAGSGASPVAGSSRVVAAASSAAGCIGTALHYHPHESSVSRIVSVAD